MQSGQGQNAYDDGNIPQTDMPQDFDPMEVSIPAPYPLNSAQDSAGQNNAGQDAASVEPLPESSRPRKDGPGGA
ncbi:MAG: hypothetical protein HFH39_01070 [Lachnospiraceae bacterium]|nr:hypothetical protein [Lachnospiraceae bacterium]